VTILDDFGDLPRQQIGLSNIALVEFEVHIEGSSEMPLKPLKLNCLA
jgi:hypothetical protein